MGKLILSILFVLFLMNSMAQRINEGEYFYAYSVFYKNSFLGKSKSGLYVHPANSYALISDNVTIESDSIHVHSVINKGYITYNTAGLDNGLFLTLVDTFLSPPIFLDTSWRLSHVDTGSFQSTYYPFIPFENENTLNMKDVYMSKVTCQDNIYDCICLSTEKEIIMDGERFTQQEEKCFESETGILLNATTYVFNEKKEVYYFLVKSLEKEAN